MSTESRDAVMPMTNLPDRAGHTVGNVEMLGRIYDEYASALFRFARAILGSADDAEDAVQEVFARIARDIVRVQHIGDLKSYLFKSTRNAAYQILRSKKRREKIEDDARQVMDFCEAKSPGCEDAAVMEAFADLPSEQREVLALKIFQGMTFKEIAEVVGKSQNTVQSRYRYAIERLKARMSE